MKFPAKFSDVVLDDAKMMLLELQPSDCGWWLLDPFAGTGRVHELRRLEVDQRGRLVMTVGTDIEPPCCTQETGNIRHDATNLPNEWSEFYDCVFTSPTYANRMADTFKPKDTSRRYTYIGAFREATGDPDYQLAENSTCGLQWTGKQGDRYRELSFKSLQEMYRVLKPGGWLLLNVSDHIRNLVRQQVCKWWRDAAMEVGFELVQSRPIVTPRNRHGENNDLRVPVEMLFVLRKGQ